MTKPVTHVAEVAVNSASIKPTSPLFIETGKESRIVPIIMTMKKLNAANLGYE